MRSDFVVGAASRGECVNVDEAGSLGSVNISFLPLRVELC